MNKYTVFVCVVMADNSRSQPRDSCGHHKSSWDDHKRCLSCTKCERDHPSSACSGWTSDTWEQAATRRQLKENKRRRRAVLFVRVSVLRDVFMMTGLLHQIDFLVEDVSSILLNQIIFVVCNHNPYNLIVLIKSVAVLRYHGKHVLH